MTLALRDEQPIAAPHQQLRTDADLRRTAAGAWHAYLLSVGAPEPTWRQRKHLSDLTRAVTELAERIDRADAAAGVI